MTTNRKLRSELKHAKRLLAWAVAGVKAGWKYCEADRLDFIEDAESFLLFGPPHPANRKEMMKFAAMIRQQHLPNRGLKLVKGKEEKKP